MISIILVKYNLMPTEVKAIRAILRHTNIPYHLIVHDNYPKKENLGKLWNKLIRKCDSDYICLINSDTIVEPNWLKKLLATFTKLEKVGVVSPSTDNCKNQQKTKHKDRFVDFDKEFPGWVLSGFCLLFPKRVWKQVNGFPENFGFYGQEVVFIKNIVKLGYKQIWRTDVFVHHDGGASIKNAEKNGELSEAEERKKNKELIKNL